MIIVHYKVYIYVLTSILCRVQLVQYVMCRAELAVLGHFIPGLQRPNLGAVRERHEVALSNSYGGSMDLYLSQSSLSPSSLPTAFSQPTQLNVVVDVSNLFIRHISIQTKKLWYSTIVLIYSV